MCECVREYVLCEYVREYVLYESVYVYGVSMCVSMCMHVYACVV